MAASLKDFKKLTQLRFSSKEVTLSDVMASLKRGSSRYTLRRSTQFTSSYLLWDTRRDDVAVCTHAFVVMYATPLDTGNFCPDGAIPPMEFKGQMRKMEPSLAAQVSLTFDTKVDPDLHEHLAYMEEWGKTKGGFSTENKSRNPWNSPLAVSSQGKFTVSSPLFQKRTGFNVTDDKYVVDYDVHPWVANACVPFNPSWVPNPNLARFMHRRKNDVLIPIERSSNPKLVPGDIVVLTFKVAFSAAGTYWQMSFMPVQAIRMGQIDGRILGKVGDLENNNRLDLPRAGDKLKAFLGSSDDSVEGSPEVTEEGFPSDPHGKRRAKQPLVERSPSISEEEGDGEPSGTNTFDLEQDQVSTEIDDTQPEATRSASWASISPPTPKGSPLTPSPTSPIISDHGDSSEAPMEYVRVTVRAKSGAKAAPESAQGNRDASKACASAEYSKSGGGKGVKRQATSPKKSHRVTKSRRRE
ncbi:hypothetical protein DFP72DRAFT_1066927 [Ephemerocybe angulata]|uniref:Uncharacterized protein n=1 Tax=Ephemerocybe angulata TaxID=980116 RepID=A0A8H6I2A6_9AGAR|nr:hypothetical protein DFP72DRAFT_1066927 [Tulosesus angulatus]